MSWPYRTHLETEKLPGSAHALIVDKLQGEMLYVLTSIESHSGYSTRQRKVKTQGRERILKGTKIESEDDLAVEQFLQKATSGGKPPQNEEQRKLSSKNVTMLEEYYCRPTLSEQ